MIAKTIANTKKATFAVQVPNPTPNAKGFPSPYGTGFFVSKDGYFITARHVLIYKQNQYEVFFDPSKITLAKPEIFPLPQTTGLKLIKEWVAYDLALLKADFEQVKSKDYFKGKNGFDYLDIEFGVPPEGTEVYSFGYPLPDFDVRGNDIFSVGFHDYRPRITSAIISSHRNVVGLAWGDAGFPAHYVIDKALNWGNSGGPIVLQESGRVISVCTHFEPVNITQGSGHTVTIPSLYGITSSLKNIEKFLCDLIQ